jgi:hypothetical protein
MHQIRGCTLGDGGHAAFASIMWSPPLTLEGSGGEDDINSSNSRTNGDFQDCLSRVSCDVLLVFGKDDPWCKPAFARKMLSALDQREPDKVHRYIEISNAGHCPNHEAPTAVSYLLHSWTGTGVRNPDRLTLVQDNNHNVFREDWGQHSIQECSADDIKLGLLDRLATTFVS